MWTELAVVGTIISSQRAVARSSWVRVVAGEGMVVLGPVRTAATPPWAASLATDATFVALRLIGLHGVPW